MTDQKFKEGMAMILEVYQRQATDMLLKAYWMVLKGLTDDEWENAVTRTLSTKTFNNMPTPAELKEQVVGDETLKAWLQAIEASGVHGGQYCIKFPNPVIHSVIKAMGGWVNFCNIPQGKDRDFKRMEFERLYKAMANKDSHPEFLQGLYNVEDNFVEITHDGSFQKIDYKPKEISDNSITEIDGLVKGITNDPL